MVLGAHVVLCVTELDFLKIISLPQNGPKIHFFELIEKIGH